MFVSSIISCLSHVRAHRIFSSIYVSLPIYLYFVVSLSIHIYVDGCVMALSFSPSSILHSHPVLPFPIAVISLYLSRYSFSYLRISLFQATETLCCRKKPSCCRVASVSSFADRFVSPEAAYPKQVPWLTGDSNRSRARPSHRPI